MKTYTTLFLLLLGSQAFAQQLVPINFSKAYQDPYFMALEADSITAILEHIETENRLVVFDLEIINKSGIPLKVDPQLFHYYAGNSPFPELSNEDDDIHLVSYPYSEIPGYLRRSLTKNVVEDHFESQIKQQQTLAIIFGVVSVGLVVADVASDVRDSKKEFYTRKDWNKSQTRDVLTASSLMTTDAVLRSTQERNYFIREDLHFLDQEIMEPVNLPDTSALRGKVYFPKNGYYRFYRVVVPLEGYNFVFDFRKARLSDF